MQRRCRLAGVAWMAWVAALLVHEPCRASFPDLATICAMVRTEVVSSAIVAVGYDAAEKILEIDFRDGVIYHFLDVPPSVHKALLRARSKGKYYNKHIIRHYQYRRVLPAS